MASLSAAISAVASMLNKIVKSISYLFLCVAPDLVRKGDEVGKWSVDDLIIRRHKHGRHLCHGTDMDTLGTSTSGVIPYELSQFLQQKFL